MWRLVISLWEDMKLNAEMQEVGNFHLLAHAL